MHRIISMCLDAAIASVVLAPIFLVLNRYYFHNTKRSFLYFLFSVYLCGVYAVVGLPDIQYIRFDPHYNIVPFAYMFSDFRNTYLNVLLFVPLGFSLPVLWKNFKAFHWTVLFGLTMSVLIESLQIFTFRATDINDLMTNTLGTVLGWIIGRGFLEVMTSIRPGWKTKEVYVISSIAFGVMFFFQPFLAKLTSHFFFSF